MKDDKLIIPPRYPPLLKEFNENRFNNDKSIFDEVFRKQFKNDIHTTEKLLKESLMTAKFELDLIKTKQGGIFKILLSNSSESTNQRKIYLKQLVSYNPNSFPGELGHDRLQKKTVATSMNNKKKNSNIYFMKQMKSLMNQKNRNQNQKNKKSSILEKEKLPEKAEKEKKKEKTPKKNELKLKEEEEENSYENVVKDTKKLKKLSNLDLEENLQFISHRESFFDRKNSVVDFNYKNEFEHRNSFRDIYDEISERDEEEPQDEASVSYEAEKNDSEDAYINDGDGESYDGRKYSDYS